MKENEIMNSKNKRYKGYQGYNKKTSEKNLPSTPQLFSSKDIEGISESNLSEPIMNVDSLLNLTNFLDTSKEESSFPEVTTLSGILKGVGQFVNERKKMKYAHEEFEMKISFLSSGIDKQYHVAMQKIQKETEVQLAQINGNVQQSILNINRYYDLELEKVLTQYELKSKEMDLYYQNLEAQRREQERRFDKMIKIAIIERKKADKAIKEAEQVCRFLRQKMYNNTITYEEREHYMELMKLRINGISSIVNIIPQLAARIK